MDEDELRQFYMAAGAALAIGGFVVLATNAMTLAVTSRHYAIPWLAYADFGVAALGLVGGTTIIARALMGKTLVGSKRARRIGNDRLFAQGCLGALLDTGSHIASLNPENRTLAAQWSVEAIHGARDFYGFARATALKTGMTFTQDERPVPEVMQPLLVRLTSMIDQTHTLKLVRSFNRSTSKASNWYKFLVDNCPYEFESMLPGEE